MNTNILVPVDFSDNSHSAARYALYLGRHLKANITLFHAVTVPVVVGDYPSAVPVEIDTEPSKEEIEKLKKELLQTLDEDGDSSVVLNTRVEVGFTVDSIMEVAKDIDADMIVMGTTGASGVEKFFIGTNAASVIDRSEIPVLLIPANAKVKPLKEIVYATNFDPEDDIMMDTLLQFAKIFGSKIHCLHVSDKPDVEDKVNLDDLEETSWHKEMGVEVEFKNIEGSDTLKALDNFIDANNIDLLVMLTHRRTIMQRLFSRSVTKEMAFHTRIPLLVFKE
jgi:nucleotide-binding universal stress UspA family protein